MNIKLKAYEVRMISHLLEIASEEFSNHGCNDIDLTDSVLDLTDAERREFTLNLALDNGDEEEISEIRNGDTRDYTNDWCAMSHFAQRFAGVELPDVYPEKESEKVSRLTAQVVRLKSDLNRLHARMGSTKDKVIALAHSL